MALWNLIFNMTIALDEIRAATRCGDWGHGALAFVLDSEPMAREVINAVANIAGCA